MNTNTTPNDQILREKTQATKLSNLKKQLSKRSLGRWIVLLFLSLSLVLAITYGYRAAVITGILSTIALIASERG